MLNSSSVINAISNLLNPQSHSGLRFKVAVEGMFTAVFTTFTMPSLEVQTEEIMEGGQNSYTHKLPVRVKVGNAKLGHGITSNMELLDWYMLVMNGDIASAKRQVTVIMYNVRRFPIVVWNFRDAYPIRWTGPELKADSNTLAIEQIEFVHHGFEFQPLIDF